MDISIVSEARLFRAPDGSIVCKTGTSGYRFWSRYLDVFDRVTVVARLSSVQIDGGALVEGPRVKVWPVPDYRGMLQYATRARDVRKAVRAACNRDSAFILRVPGVLGGLASDELRRARRAYGAEVLGDPYEVFSSRIQGGLVDPMLRWWFTRSLRRQCQTATAVAYVTESALQRGYPSSNEAFATHYSDVELPLDAIAERPVASRPGDGPWVIAAVGSLAQMYKGADVLLDAIALCRSAGLDVRLVWAGDGQYRGEMEARADSLGIRDFASFVGKVPAGTGVREILDQADLFVMSSRTEGLPRALIEAMARGLPCLGTRVGGIPELLEEDDLVMPDDAAGLGGRIREVLLDPGRRDAMAERNLRRAADYRMDVLHGRRTRFYRELLERTARS